MTRVNVVINDYTDNRVNYFYLEQSIEITNRFDNNGSYQDDILVTGLLNVSFKLIGTPHTHWQVYISVDGRPIIGSGIGFISGNYDDEGKARITQAYRWL